MSPRLLPASVVVVALALVGGGLYLGLGGSGSDTGTVLTAPAATRPPAAVIDIDGSTTTVAVLEGAPETTVLSTADPSPESAATTVAVATGEDGLVPVPNVIGQARAVAESRLVAFDVTVEVVVGTAVSDFDEITSQSAAPGERLAPGAPIDLVFSERPAPETVAADPLDPSLFDLVEAGDLEAGDCAVFMISERTLLYDPIDCSEPHDLQVLARVLLEGGPEEFDQEVIDSLLRSQCGPIFFDYVGVTVNDSDALRLATVRPNPERYENEGERDSMCVLFAPNGLRIIGSAQDTLW